MSTRSDEELFDVHKGNNPIPVFRYLGMLIKKFKISNFAAILILLAADLGIGYFTLPVQFSLNLPWCKESIILRF
jgi:hypothetical protein